MKYAEFEDCTIDRTEEPGSAVLRDNEGTRLFDFHADTTDKQIRQALRFANSAFAKGAQYGSEQRAAQIRAALGTPAAVEPL